MFKALTAMILVMSACSVHASWKFTPSKVYLDENGKATFSLYSDGNEAPTDFVVSVVDRKGEKVKGIMVYPRIINQAGLDGKASEIKIRKLRTLEEKFIFLKVKSLSETSRLTFKARIVTK